MSEAYTPTRSQKPCNAFELALLLTRRSSLGGLRTEIIAFSSNEGNNSRTKEKALVFQDTSLLPFVIVNNNYYSKYLTAPPTTSWWFFIFPLAEHTLQWYCSLLFCVPVCLPHWPASVLLESSLPAPSTAPAYTRFLVNVGCKSSTQWGATQRLGLRTCLRFLTAAFF